MSYRLIMTHEMQRLLDKNIDYLVHRLQNRQAAKHLLNEIERIYENLKINPEIYRESKDPVLQVFHYHEAIVSGMDYVIIYRIQDSSVFLLGIFHTRENYSGKVLSLHHID